MPNTHRAEQESILLFADDLEERLARIPCWSSLTRLEQQFLTAYACTGEKQAALAFINRHVAWCYDWRFRTEAFRELVTGQGEDSLDAIASMRTRLLNEAMAQATLGALLLHKAVLDAPISRRTGITAATQLRAARSILQIAGVLD